MRKVKIIVIWLLISAIFINNFVYAQLSVPVVDESANKLLGTIGGILGAMWNFLNEEIQRLNTRIEEILTFNMKENATKFITDSIKEIQNKEYLSEVKTITEINRIKSQEDIKGEIEEAQTAGAAKALAIIKGKYNCLEARAKEKIADRLEEIYFRKGIDLKDSARLLIESLPDCPVSLLTQTTSLTISKQKLVLPFNIGDVLLAQAAPSEINLPSIEIIPQHDQLASNLEVDAVISDVARIINENISQTVEERRKQLGEVKPLFESCNDFSLTDKGRSFCLEYDVPVKLDDDIKTTLSFNTSPSARTFSDENVFVLRSEPIDILSELGLIATPTPLRFYTTTEVEAVVEKSCGSPTTTSEIEESNEAVVKVQRALNKAKCVETFVSKLKTVSDVLAKKLEGIEDRMHSNARLADELKGKADGVKGGLNKCGPKGVDALKDVENISKELEAIASSTRGLGDSLNGFNTEIKNRLNSISREISGIKNRINTYANKYLAPLKTLETVTRFIDSIGSKIASYIPIVGRFIDAVSNIKEAITQVNTDLNNALNEIFGDVARVITDLDTQINNSTILMSNLTGVYNLLSGQGIDKNFAFNQTALLGDYYRLKKIEEKLEFYKVLADKCSSTLAIIIKRGSNLAKSSLKRKVIVVEKSINDKSKGFTLFNLASLFKQKVIEITFSK